MTEQIWKASGIQPRSTHHSPTAKTRPTDVKMHKADKLHGTAEPYKGKIIRITHFPSGPNTGFSPVPCGSVAALENNQKKTEDKSQHKHFAKSFL